MLSRPDAILGQVVWFTQILLFFFLESLSRASVSFGHHDLEPSLGQYVIFVFCILKFWVFIFFCVFEPSRPRAILGQSSLTCQG